jgi:type I restriction enzyme, S subunit
MSNSWPMVALGEVIRQRKEFIQIDDLAEYKRCRVQLHGQGIVLRDIAMGSEVKTKSQQVCRAGEFLVAEIDAKVGGFGIVPEALEGAIVSSHYFLFVIDEKRLDRQFLDSYIRTPTFFQQVQAQGSTNYAAIRPTDVLGYTLPLPPPDEQRRIVRRIEALTARIAEARGLRREAAEEEEALLQSITAAEFQTKGTGTVRDYATVQSGYAFESEWFSDGGIRLVRNINIGHGSIVWGQVMRLPEDRRVGFERFELLEGDILISLDRPIISTGVKVARVSACDVPSLLLQRVGRVQFRNDKVLPDYFFAWLRSPMFINAIDPGRSNGVPHISPKDIERLSFSPPSLSEQRHAVDYVRDVWGRVDALTRLQAETATELAALLPSVLDQAFRGEL